MLNTVERRRALLFAVVALIIFHMFASGTLINADAISDPEIRTALQEFYTEYSLLWSGL